MDVGLKAIRFRRSISISLFHIYRIQTHGLRALAMASSTFSPIGLEDHEEVTPKESESSKSPLGSPKGKTSAVKKRQSIINMITRRNKTTLPKRQKSVVGDVSEPASKYCMNEIEL